MAATTRTWTLGELAQILNGRLEGPANIQITRPVQAGSDDPEGITFAESAKYLEKAIDTSVGAILVPRGTSPCKVPTIEVDNPRAAFGMILGLSVRPLPLAAGIHPTAVVHERAKLGEGVRVGAYSVVEEDAVLGDGCRIYPFCYIGEGCVLGAKVSVYPHAVLYQDVRVGDRSVIHAGTVIGADGFGYVWDSKAQTKRIKIPQVGTVDIGEDVEIGACTTIDRATAGSTSIGNGSKLDNLVQIAHNCKIGNHSVIAAQTGFGGSSSLGNRSDVGGHVAVTDHAHVGDDIIVAGRTGVMNDIKEPGAYWGLPARPIMTAKRIMAVFVKLPEIYKSIKELERRTSELEKTTK